ncbi:MAG: hypothetical protein RL264_2320 [Bacteroidota bacterium]|jgi:ABC-type multidrug transport system fused ATPase/permease subunit
MLSPKRNKDKEKVKLSKNSWKSVKKLLGYLKPYGFQYFIGWIFLLFSTLAGLVFPYLMGKLLGVSGTNISDVKTIFTLNSVNDVAIGLFVLFGIQAGFSFLRIVIFTNVTENALRDLRDDAFKKMIFKPMDFFNQHKVGELTSRISSDIVQIQETLKTTIAELFRQIIMVVGGIIFLFFISWKLSLIMLATVPVMALIAVFFGRFIRRLGKEAQDFTAQSNNIVEEALSGIANVKAFTNEYFLINKFKVATQETRNLNVKSGLWRGLFVSFIIFCLFGAIVFIIWQGLLMTQGEHPALSKEGFYQFVLFTIMMGASIGSLPELYATFQKSVGATENLFDLMDLEGESEDENAPRIDVEGAVSFQSVGFSYPQRSDMEVLKNVSFSAPKNTSIALVGSSGSGKSTITNLILRFYENFSGDILIDGKPILDFDARALRQHIAIVPQDVLLFSGSIRENILFGRPDATEEEIVAAAQQANAWDFISSFPEKLETQVGDRGIQLSGGQKQRIAIARAILKNPSILILDEATSALDSESEKLVQDAIDKIMKGRTSITIAHRLSTIRNADQILVLRNGEVVESGNHDTLMQQNGNYADMVRLQTLQG